MAAPTALETIRTGTPDGSAGLLIANISSQESATTEIPAGVALSDRIPANASADRTVTTEDTSTTDMSSAGFSSSGLIAVNNRGALVVYCTFEDPAGSATFRLAYYDGHSTPVPLFMGPALSFSALAQRKSSSGYYLSEPQIVESYGASHVKPYCTAHHDDTDDVSIWVHPV